jgi:hypothetical protein
VLVGRLLGKQGWAELSKAEEPEGRDRTVTVVGAD